MKSKILLILILLSLSSKASQLDSTSIMEIHQKKVINLHLKDEPYIQRTKRQYFLGGVFVTTLVFFAIGYANN